MLRKKAKRLIRNGRRIYGAIYELPSGHQVYLAWRTQSEIFRGGELTNSDALVKHKAAWALDNDTLLDLRREGITIVGVYVKDTGDKYITHIANFFDRSKSKVMNYESRGGALQSYLPLENFAIRLGATRIK